MADALDSYLGGGAAALAQPPSVSVQNQLPQSAPAAVPQSAPIQQAPTPTQQDALGSYLGSGSAPQPAPPSPVPGNQPDGSAPGRALPQMPVGPIDALRLGLGNTAGSIDYLKKQFPNVTYDKDKGIVVQDMDGRWKQVDPSLLGSGDAWSKTKEVAKNLVGIGINAAMTTSALAGAPETGGASLLLAGAGGTESGVIRTSLGRLAGTYKADPLEQMKDIGLEALLNAGGQKVALGLKPRIGQIINAVSNAGEWASDSAKSAMKVLLGATLPGADPKNVARIVDNAAPVMAELDKASSGAASHEVPNNITANIMNYAKAHFDGAGKAASDQFERDEANMLSKVPATFVANPEQAAHSAGMTLTQAGFVNPVAGQSGNLIGYRMKSYGDIMNMLSQHGPVDAESLGKALPQLKKFVDSANSMIGKKSVAGADGVESLINIRRAFDNFYYNATDASEAAKEFLTPASSNLRTSLVNQIKAASPEVASAYDAMNQGYKNAMPIVQKAARIIKTPDSLETFSKQIQGGNKVTAQQALDLVAKLKGDAGAESRERILNAAAAGDFIGRWPQIANWKAAAAAGGAVAGAHALGPMGTIGTMAAGAAAMPAAAMSSPRLVGRSLQAAQALPYAQLMGNFLKAMPVNKMRQFMSDDNLFPGLVQSTVQATQGAQALKQGLLNQAGIGGPNAPQQ